MRTIKFRTFDAEGKFFFYYRIENGSLLVWEGDAPGLVGYVPDLETAQQFTGLHDKNGNEIYEGDILRRRTSNGGVETIDVRYKAPRFCIGDYAPEYGYVVIGNIYENSDLLRS